MSFEGSVWLIWWSGNGETDTLLHVSVDEDALGVSEASVRDTDRVGSNRAAH